MTNKYIDINCDLGEGDTEKACKEDARLMPYITRCNIACGQHAGNTKTMLSTLKNAAANHILVGAHPSYPDRTNFGRISMRMQRKALEDCLIQQIDTLQAQAKKQAMTLSHIKLHGALYNDTEQRAEQALWVAECIKTHYPSLSVLGLAGGYLEAACQKQGLAFIREGFMDRRYTCSGQLTPRSQTGAMIDHIEQSIEQAINLASGQPVISDRSTALLLDIDSICLHGDNSNAVPIAKALSAALKEKGMGIL